MLACSPPAPHHHSPEGGAGGGTPGPEITKHKGLSVMWGELTLTDGARAVDRHQRAVLYPYLGDNCYPALDG